MQKNFQQTWPLEWAPAGDKPWIMTHSGRRVNPLNVQIDDVDITDIAHALALTNRFGGHTVCPITVAQHSVLVSRMVPKEHAMQGLLHDASEAYLGDVTKWLKGTPAFEQYRISERLAEQSIYVRFGCCIYMHPAVEVADWRMVVFEASVGYGDKSWLGEPEPHPVLAEWSPWPWARARREFLDRFAQLGGKP